MQTIASRRPSNVLAASIPLAKLGVEAELEARGWGSFARGERWRGAIFTRSKEYVDVDLLVADKSAIASEALTFVVSALLGTPVLPSYLVQIDSEYLLDSKLWKPEERQKFGFGIQSSAFRTTATFDLSLLAQWRHLPNICMVDALLGITRSTAADFAFDGSAFYPANNAVADCIPNVDLWQTDRLELRIHPSILEELRQIWTPSQLKLFRAMVRQLSFALESIDFEGAVGAAHLPAILGPESARSVVLTLEHRVPQVFRVVCQQFGFAPLRFAS